MARLNNQQFRRLNKCIAAIYAQCDLQALPQQMIAAITDLIPMERAGYNEIQLEPRRVLRLVATGDSYPQPLFDVFERYAHEHPLIAYTYRHPEHAPVQISDFLTKAQFHRTHLYNEFFRKIEVEHQMAVGIATHPGIIVGLAINRARYGFSETDRTMLDHLRPHLQQAYRNAAALELVTQRQQQTEELLQTVAPGLLLVSPAGEIHHATDAARRLLAKYFPQSISFDRLPEDWIDWLGEHIGSARDAAGPPRPCFPFMEYRPGRCLSVRLIPRRDETYCLILQEHSIEQRIKAYQQLTLTPRQAEVLAWLVMGKTDAEIALLLGTSQRTIEKHLERIYETLGVQSRVAAVMKAMEVSD